MSADDRARRVWERHYELCQLAGVGADEYGIASADLDEPLPGQRSYSPSEALAWTDSLAAAPIPAGTRAAAQRLAQGLLEAAREAGGNG